MRAFHALFTQRRIVVGARRFAIKGKVKLIGPSELKSRLTHGVVANLGTGNAFSQVRSVCSNLVGNEPGTHVVFIR